MIRIIGALGVGQVRVSTICGLTCVLIAGATACDRHCQVIPINVVSDRVLCALPGLRLRRHIRSQLLDVSNVQ